MKKNIKNVALGTLELARDSLYYRTHGFKLAQGQGLGILRQRKTALGPPANVVQLTKTPQRESWALFQKFVESAPVAISLARAGMIAFLNSAYLAKFGLDSSRELLGQPMLDQIAPQSREYASSRFQLSAKGFFSDDEFEVFALCRGQSLMCRLVVKELSFSDGPVTVIFCLEMTKLEPSDRKRETSQRRLRRLTVYLLHAREEERKMVAREIHDELGQMLTAMKMEMQWIEQRSGPHSASLQERIAGVVHLTDQMIEAVHKIASELRPAILDDLGLKAALEWLGGDFSRQNGIPCRIDVSASESLLDCRYATDLFRVVQEALTNVAHHAQASFASVEIWEENQELRIRIQDDGVGITVEQATGTIAFGLLGIRERLQGLRGDMSIFADKGKGTTFLASVPFPLERMAL